MLESLIEASPVMKLTLFKNNLLRSNQQLNIDPLDEDNGFCLKQRIAHNRQASFSMVGINKTYANPANSWTLKMQPKTTKAG